jgi:hypothetical protein
LCRLTNEMDRPVEPEGIGFNNGSVNEEKSWNKASVALANKHARIAWAIFCQRHLSSCRQLLCR